MLSNPSRVSLREYVDYLPSQGNIGCCTASASLLALEILLASKGNRVNLSRLFLYYMTRKESGRIGEKGATLSGTLESLKRYGSPLEIYWPLTYFRTDTEPDEHAKQEALRFKIYSYVDISSNSYKEYLSSGIPIIVGIRTGKLFWELAGPFEEHRYIPINGSNNRISHGHAITIIGYDDNLNNGSWIIANSMGPKWGFHGYAAIPYSCNVDIGESYVITAITGNLG